VGESQKHKIVIVEDEGLIAEDIRRQLIAAGYQVPGMADAAPEAMRVIRATRPEVVLMDIRIKGEQDGIHVARRVREDLDVPVVFLTAYEDAQTLERASEVCPYGYIRKPVSGASLRGSIEIAIAKHRKDREIREQRDWAMANFAAMPCAVILTDRSGRITWLNSAAVELTGSSREAAARRHWSEVIMLYYGATGGRVEDLVLPAMNSSESISFPAGVMLARPGAQERIAVEGSIAPTNHKGHVGAVIALQNATRVRFEQEQRVLAYKHAGLRRLVEAMTQRLANLQVVQAAWETVVMVDKLNPAPGVRESVSAVQGAVMDSFSLASSLAALLKSPEVRLQRVVLNELLPELERALQPNAPDLDILVSSEPICVHADAKNLSSALLTFVQQARRRMRRGGRLVIDVSHPEMKDMRHWVRIRLTYPSAEAPAAAVERAFEPRWQAAAQDPYMAYESIRNMGGVLMAHAGEGETVAVEIYLQNVRAAAAGREFRDIAAHETEMT